MNISSSNIPNFVASSYSCKLCGLTKKDQRVSLPGIHFVWLAGAPFVCEKCVYKAITGQDLDWRAEAKSWLNKTNKEDIK